MNYLSLFTGVGGLDLGFHAAGLHCAAMVEWDSDCRTILDRHWPDTPKWDDVQNYTHHQPTDIVTGGFPCQDVSQAGQRAGIGHGTRSGLYSHIIRIVKEMQHATDGILPRWVVLENVRGILSHDKGRTFGRVLDDLADLGAVAIEWAMLDTQHFGPPQRRQRIFIIAQLDPRTASRGGRPLLAVGTGSRRDPQQSQTPGQEPPDRTGGSPRGRRLVADTGILTALTAMEGMTRPDLAHAQAGWLVNTYQMQGFGDYRPDAVASTVQARDWKGPTDLIVPFCAYPDDQGVTPGALKLVTTDIAPCIAASDGAKTSDRGLRVAYPQHGGVRRLTPLECERLQGWPDNHTRWRADSSEQSDTVRYRQIGNGISAPVAEWVARQIIAAEHEQDSDTPNP